MTRSNWSHDSKHRVSNTNARHPKWVAGIRSSILGLLAEFATLNSRAAEKLAVLLLRHALAALLDHRTHSGNPHVLLAFAHAGHVRRSCAARRNLAGTTDTDVTGSALVARNRLGIALRFDVMK
jgi:hypothetical protein